MSSIKYKNHLKSMKLAVAYCVGSLQSKLQLPVIVMCVCRLNHQDVSYAGNMQQSFSNISFLVVHITPTFYLIENTELIGMKIFSGAGIFLSLVKH